MKIAVTMFFDISALDGTTVRAMRIAEIFGKSHFVEIISRHHNKSASDLPDVKNLGLRMFIRLFQAVCWNAKLSYKVLANKYDIVYCSYDYLGFFCIALWSRIKKYRIIYEAHGILAEEAKIYNWPKPVVFAHVVLEKFIIRNSNYILTLAPNIYEYYSSRSGNVGLVPVFVDEELFHPVEIENKNDSPVLGLIGPFLDNSPRKLENLHFLYSNIDKIDKQFHFLIIGKCIEQIDNPRIKYTGYLESMKDYIDAIHKLDAVLVPEKIPTTGPLNKIIEPMACGIPVITTPQGIVGLYWIEPGSDILVFEMDKLVAELNGLVKINNYFHMIGQNAVKVISQYYGKKVNEAKLLGIIQTVDDRKAGKPA